YSENGTYVGFVGSCINVDLPVSAPAPADQVQHDLTVRNAELETKIRSGIEALAQSEMLMHAMNEELSAANEELAAINEELTATNEELRLTKEDLAESEFRTRSIIENAPFPIAVYMGREMRIVEANQAIMDVWGKGNDVIGKRYAEVLPELEDQQIFEKLDAVFTTGVPFHTRNERIDLDIHGERKTFYF